MLNLPKKSSWGTYPWHFRGVANIKNQLFKKLLKEDVQLISFAKIGIFHYFRFFYYFNFKGEMIIRNETVLGPFKKE